jgi:hypothetical protein
MFNRKQALMLLLLGALLPLCACASTPVCPPNEPIFEWKEVPKPYPVIIKIPELGEVVLPEYPPHPGEDADDAELKAWALEIKHVASEREEILLARIKADQHLIETHNLFVPANPENPE